jgi:hypothetical protein
MRRRLPLIVGGSLAALAAAAVVVYFVRRPRALGLEHSRVVLVAGDATADGSRPHAKDVVLPGAELATGRGAECVSIRASRVCIGAGAQLTLTNVVEGSVAIELKRGTAIVTAVSEPVRVTLKTAALTVHGGTVAIEETESPVATVRALDGTAKLEPAGKPAVDVASGSAVSAHDGKAKPAAADLDREERAVASLAGKWQGSAGGVVAVKGQRARVEVDGAVAGTAPAEVLVDEGQHVLVLREGSRELHRETLTIERGQRVERSE